VRGCKAARGWFDLKRPCINCPFRIGQGERYQLAPKTLRDIRNGPTFQCHKTVDYDHFRDPIKRQGDNPQMCAGLIAVLHRDGDDNTIMQIASRVWGVDFSGFDPDNEAYPTWAAVVEAHRGDRWR
jgi:hypothetical protein